MMSDKLIGSLFSGIGGIDLGFEQSGCKVAWAIERDSACCKTYRYNFPNSRLLETDIRNVDPSKLCPVHIIAAGFPCQPFSVAGRQLGFQDKRGNSFFEIIRFMEALKPEAVFLENVPNLMEHDNGRTFNIIYNALAEQGYYIRYKVMRASEYGGVPQIRNRIYIVAFRNVEVCENFRYPEPIGLSTDIFAVLKQNQKKHTIYYYQAGDRFYDRAIRVVKSKSYIYRVYHDSVKPTQNQMCPTLTASMGVQNNQVPLVLDDCGLRKLTIEECLEFQGFPADYRFPNTIDIQNAYKQIGNTVCVPVIRRIAENIVRVCNKNI